MGVAQHPLLQLARVSGRDAQGVDARPLGAIHNVSVTLEAGVHAFVGRPEDGTVALCELISGRRAPSVGVVSVCGREPAGSAATRRRMGTVLPRPNLVTDGTVQDALTLMGAVRNVSLGSCLDAFGAAQLLQRSVRSLDDNEARAVELAAALSVPDLWVLTVYEPSTIAALDGEVVRRRLAAQAERGTCVVIATGSPEELGSLPQHVYLLEGGRLWGRDEEVGWAVHPADPEHPAGVRAPLCSISLWTTEPDARRLASELSARDAVEAERWGVHDGGLAEIVVSGLDLELLALTVADVVAATGVEVSAMHSALASLSAMRAAARAHRAGIEERARFVAPTAPPASSSSGDAGAEAS